MLHLGLNYSLKTPKRNNEPNEKGTCILKPSPQLALRELHRSLQGENSPQAQTGEMSKQKKICCAAV